MLTVEINGLLEDSIDLFDKLCKNMKDEDISVVMDIIFNLYIPLVKILQPINGECISIYKRIMMSLYSYISI